MQEPGGAGRAGGLDPQRGRPQGGPPSTGSSAAKARLSPTGPGPEKETLTQESKERLETPKHAARQAFGDVCTVAPASAEVYRDRPVYMAVSLFTVSFC